MVSFVRGLFCFVALEVARPEIELAVARSRISLIINLIAYPWI